MTPDTTAKESTPPNSARLEEIAALDIGEYSQPQCEYLMRVLDYIIVESEAERADDLKEQAEQQQFRIAVRLKQVTESAEADNLNMSEKLQLHLFRLVTALSMDAQRYKTTLENIKKFDYDLRTPPSEELHDDDVKSYLQTISQNLWIECGKDPELFLTFRDKLDDVLDLVGWSIAVPSVGDDYNFMAHKKIALDDFSWMESGVITEVVSVGFHGGYDQDNMHLAPKVKVNR